MGAIREWLTGVARRRGVDNYYKNEIDFLAVPYILIPTHPLTCNVVGENKAEAVSLDLEQPWSVLSFWLGLCWPECFASPLR